MNPCGKRKKTLKFTPSPGTFPFLNVLVNLGTAWERGWVSNALHLLISLTSTCFLVCSVHFSVVNGVNKRVAGQWVENIECWRHRPYPWSGKGIDLSISKNRFAFLRFVCKQEWDSFLSRNPWVNTSPGVMWRRIPCFPLSKKIGFRKMIFFSAFVRASYKRRVIEGLEIHVCLRSCVHIQISWTPCFFEIMASFKKCTLGITNEVIVLDKLPHSWAWFRCTHCAVWKIRRRVLSC